jgi:hypothetical protein
MFGVLKFTAFMTTPPDLSLRFMFDPLLLLEIRDADDFG